MVTIEDVKKSLGEFVDDYTVDLQGDVVVVKAKHFVPKEEWDKINNGLRDLGGKWTSMGKASHWRIPIQTSSNIPKEADVCPHCGKIIVILDSVKYEISHRVVKE